MAEQMLHLLEQASWYISLFAVAVIVVGFTISLLRYFILYKRTQFEKSFSLFKAELGRFLLLGLEILVLADVIETITTEPDLKSLAMLAFLVALRTIVGWTLSLEVEGRWPWQNASKEELEVNNS